MSPKLTAGQSAAAFEALVVALGRGRSAEGPLLIEPALLALAGQITADQVGPALDTALGGIKRAPTADIAGLLARAAAILIDSLPANQTLDAFHGVLAIVQSTSGLDTSNREVALMARSLAGRLTPDQARSAIGPALDALVRSVLSTLVPLAQTIAALRVPLDTRQQGIAIELSLKAVSKAQNYVEIEKSAPAVTALAGLITPEQAQAALPPVIEAMRYANGDDARLAVAQAVHALVGRLTPEQARMSLTPAVIELAVAASFAPLEPLMRVLPSSVAADSGRAALEPTLQALARETNVLKALRLAQTVQALGIPVSAEQGRIALRATLKAAAVNRDTDNVTATLLIKAVHMFAAPLQPEQVREALSPVLAVLGTEESLKIRKLLTAVVQGTAVLLPPPEELALQTPILNAVVASDDPWESQALLRLLIGKPSSEQLAAPMASIAARLAWSDNEGIAEAWAATWALALARQTPGQRVTALVQALRYPTAAGSATAVLLDALHDTDPGAPGSAAGLDATLTWLRTAYPGIDLARPAACPSPPPDQRGLSCPAQDR